MKVYITNGIYVMVITYFIFRVNASGPSWLQYIAIRNMICMQPNELSVSLKLAILIAVGLAGYNCQLLPFYVLPHKKPGPGHPYMLDFLMKCYSTAANDLISSLTTDNSVRSVTAITDEFQLKVIIEIKKSVATDLVMVDCSALIEMLIYT